MCSLTLLAKLGSWSFSASWVLLFGFPLEQECSNSELMITEDTSSTQLEAPSRKNAWELEPVQVESQSLLQGMVGIEEKHDLGTTDTKGWMY